MVYLMDLWMPIVLSAVAVFMASSITHMVLTYHQRDYQKLPNESAVIEAMRNAGVGPGNYHFPHAADLKAAGTPEMIAKFSQGPVGLLNVTPSGPPAMGKSLGQWFAFCLVVGVMVAYLTGRTLGPGTEYLAVFRVAGTVAFLAFSGSEVTNSIWKGQRWATTARHLVDGLLYGLLAGGVFGWLWP